MPLQIIVFQYALPCLVLLSHTDVTQEVVTTTMYLMIMITLLLIDVRSPHSSRNQPHHQSQSRKNDGGSRYRRSPDDSCMFRTFSIPEISVNWVEIGAKWILDTVTTYFWNNKNLSANFKPLSDQEITIAVQLSFLLKAIAILNCFFGQRLLTLTNVMNSSWRSLISSPQLDKHGAYSRGSGGKVTVSRGGNVRFKAFL